MFEIHQVSSFLDDGREVIIETGKMARQADGSVVVKMGDTMLLATVVSATEAKADVDFMPLSVDYQEKFASVGRFPGGFTRREGRPSDNEILTARLVDRALRPLFPKDYHADTFVNVYLISADKNSMPDALAGLAASAALAVSNIPFNGPISEVRVARIDGKFVINPSLSDNQNADIDMMVAATMDSIMMVEGEMSEVSEEDMLEAMRVAHEAIKKQCQIQIDLRAKVGVTPREYSHEQHDEELRAKLSEFSYDKVYAIVSEIIKGKHERHDKIKAVFNDFMATLPEDAEVNKALAKQYFSDVEKKASRRLVLDTKVRLDGRKPNQIRQIAAEVDILPAAHGSALFTRGETQSLTTVTLGSALDEKLVDEALRQGKDKFLLHYNFPPFSTNDARPVRGVGRREIGHGNLALRALKRMMPSHSDSPYTVRIVSDILESNGSSSMATVCAGTLAIMDSGLKLKRPVSGIAMGLITDGGNDNFVVLSDILGDEDHLGDMDFKVTGTEKGITACQMDIKVSGLSYEVLSVALNQAKEGRAHILSKMVEVLSEPRDDYKPHAPRIEKIIIPKEFIGAVIGPGGKIIQQIQLETATTINIEEVDNFGYVSIASSNKEAIEAAKKWVKGIVAVPEVGTVYQGKVKSIVEFGAFIEVLPGKEGLLHVSEIDWKRVEDVKSVLKEGDIVEVKLLEMDKRSGKMKLSRKALLPRPPRKD